MKTRKRKNLLLLILTALMLILIVASCSAKQSDMTAQETYINTNVSQYGDYVFWEKENELRLFVPRQSPAEENQEEEKDILILRLVEPTAQEQHIAELRQGIIWYFLTKHNIDLSSKTLEQKVIFYETNEAEGTLGYINKNNPNVIMMNVNTMENGEQSNLFNETFIELTLKQLGFAESSEGKAITEGIVNALTERILNFMSLPLTFEESYIEATKIAHQLLEADSEIVKCYLGDEPSSVIDRINDKIKEVPRAYNEDPNPASRMENILESMNKFNNDETFAFVGEPHCLLFEAQEIARAYCKECKPSKETIDYIRTKYLLSDFEELKVRIDPDEGNGLE